MLVKPILSIINRNTEVNQKKILFLRIKLSIENEKDSEFLYICDCCVPI